MSSHHGESLERFLYLKRINRTQLSEKLEISKATLYNWFGKRELPLDTLTLLKNEIGFSPDGDYSTEDSNVQLQMAKEPEETGRAYKVPKFKPNIIYVPLYAFGGFMTGYRDTIFIDSLERFSLPGVSGEHYAFEISGMSMYKSGEELSASPGDIAISRPVDGFNYLMKGKGYILQTVEGILYKIFDKLDDKLAHFHSLNPDYDGHKIPLKEIKRLYFVNFILKKTK
jgi:hypothetical protein